MAKHPIIDKSGAMVRLSSSSELPSVSVCAMEGKDTSISPSNGKDKRLLLSETEGGQRHSHLLWC